VTVTPSHDRNLPSGDAATQKLPLDPLERLQHQLLYPPYHRFLRVQPISADIVSGRAVIRLPFRSEFRRSPDLDDYHGGILAALVDIAAHAAVAVRAGRPALTIDLRIDYLRPVPGLDLTATARVLKFGASVAWADVEITGADPTLLVYGRGTFSTREP
jgi:uncharacterized protein (TIGR00369 family)